VSPGPRAPASGLGYAGAVSLEMLVGASLRSPAVSGGPLLGAPGSTEDAPPPEGPWTNPLCFPLLFAVYSPSMFRPPGGGLWGMVCS